MQNPMKVDELIKLRQEPREAFIHQQNQLRLLGHRPAKTPVITFTLYLLVIIMIALFVGLYIYG